MPRAAGQVDEKKSEAILDAAAALFAERGGQVSMDEIARQAGVSKQTLYNRFASKIEIGRAVAARRSDAVTAPLRGEGDALTVLTALAAAMKEKVCASEKGASLRVIALMSPSAPDIAQAIYDAGPRESVLKLAAWLKDQDRAGALDVPDPQQAAEMFVGMALGHSHLRTMLGVPHPEIMDMQAWASEVAARFIRAFAPSAPA